MPRRNGHRFGRLGGVSEYRSAVMREEKRADDEYRTGYVADCTSGGRHLPELVCIGNGRTSSRGSNLSFAFRSHVQRCKAGKASH